MSLPMVVDTVFRSEERFTQQEFSAWLQRRPASDVDHYELIRGRIVMSPPAGWPHGSLGVRISSRLFVTVYCLDRGHYGAGERVRAGRIPSHVLPQLDLTAEDLFAD